MEQAVLFEVENQIAMITLNRPERRNAINQTLLQQLYDSLDKVNADDGIKAAIITGNGKAFCSGIDLAFIGKDNFVDPRGDGSDLPDVFSACKKPVIGAVNGYAITGGFEIALNCDFLIASENASFADTHAKVGIHPGWGLTQMLQQAVGQPMAKQMSMTCQFISAEKALDCGLVNEVVKAEELLPRSLEIASQICETNYPMLITVKGLIENRKNRTFDEALKIEREGFAAFAKQFM